MIFLKLNCNTIMYNHFSKTTKFNFEHPMTKQLTNIQKEYTDTDVKHIKYKLVKWHFNSVFSYS